MKKLIRLLSFCAAVPVVLLAGYKTLWNANDVSPVPRPGKWAVEIETAGVPNLHKVSDVLYRSAQPTAEGMTNLVALGIKTVVNLRTFQGDGPLCAGLPLRTRHISVFTGNMKDEYVRAFLDIVDDADAVPVLVHCRHGADRTGTMCALYRTARQGWSVEEAITEMKDGGYGFHPVWFNLPRYIRKNHGKYGIITSR